MQAACTLTPVSHGTSIAPRQWPPRSTGGAQARELKAAATASGARHPIQEISSINRLSYYIFLCQKKKLGEEAINLSIWSEVMNFMPKRERLARGFLVLASPRTKKSGKKGEIPGEDLGGPDTMRKPSRCV